MSTVEQDRIQKIIDALSRATEGEYSARLDFASEDDDIGSLANAVNTLLEKTGKKISGIHTLSQNSALDAGRYHHILNTIQESYFEADLKGHLLFFNDTALRDLGYDEKELEGIHFHRLVNAINAQKVYDAFHQVFLTGLPNKGFEWEILKKNNEIIEVESSVALLCDEGGKPVGFRGVVRDISLRKKTERDLRIQQEKYRTVLENMEDTYLENDLKGNYTFFNDSLCRLLGYAREELQGKNYRLIAPPEQHEELYRAYNEIYTTGEPKIFREQKMIARDGAPLYFDYSMSLMRSPTGEPIGFCGFGRNVTAQVMARKKLEESERKLRLITANISDIIWTMDFDMRLTYVSPSVVPLTGFTPEEVMRIPVSMMVSPETFAQYQQLLADELAGEQAGTPPDRERPVSTVLPLLRKDGTTYWAEINISFNRDEHGRAFEIIGVTRDVTDRKRIEDALKDTKALYQMLFENAPYGMVVLDPETARIMEFNDTACRQLGYSREEFAQLDVSDLDIYESPQEIRSKISAVMRQGRTDFETRHRTKLGKIRDVYVTAQYTEVMGKPLYHCVWQDITDLKSTEEALRNSERRYRLIVENIHDIVWIIGLDLKFNYVSPSNIRVSGFTREEVMTKSLQDFLTPESLARATQILSEELAREAGGYPVDPTRSRIFELEVYTKSGGAVWVEVSAAFNRDEYGNAVEILAVGRNITERKQAEEALRRSEEKYRTILESMEDGYWEVDLEGRFTFFNDAMCRMSQCTREELLGLKVSDYVTPETKERMLEIFTEVFRTGLSAEYMDYEVLKRDGTTGIYELSASLMRNDEGMPVGFRGITRDVTKRSVMEQALEESERRYRMITEKMTDIVWITDKDLHVRYVSPSIQHILGFSQEERMQMTVADQFTPESLSIGMDAWARELALEEQDGADPERSATLVLEYYHKDGTTRWMETTMTGIRDDRGALTGLHGVSRDVTERKKAEEALEESERRYRMIVENMRDVIMVVGLNLKEHYRSPSATELTGYSLEELAEIPLKEQITPESYALMEKALVEELEKEHGPGPVDFNRSRTLELELYHKNGGTVWIEETTSFLRDDGGNPVAILIAARDITARKRAEEEKDALEKQLMQAQRMETVGRLAGGVAHDFNNMLSVILGYVDLAKLRLTEEHPVIKDLGEIEKAALRSRDITAQLLAFSRRQVIAPKVIDLNEMILLTQKSLIRLIGEHIDLAVVLDKNLGPIKIDPSQIEQILVNLAVNGRDAMPDGGTLTIETKNIAFDDRYCRDHIECTPGCYVQLTVSDSGEGMGRTTMQHIFEPFFTTKEIGKGTGLGLATVYGIVKQNNGVISVYSERGHGTTFKIYLPRTMEEQKIQEELGAIPIPAGEGTILLVEDDPMVLDITRGMLKSLGYGVITAKTPLEALAIFKKQDRTIDLVITDVIMPSMSGKELTDTFITLSPDVKVLFMSGYTADAIAHHGVLERGVHFLQKPFSIRDLARTVKEVMET